MEGLVFLLNLAGDALARAQLENAELRAANQALAQRLLDAERDSDDGAPSDEI